jgi:hypothetical protein
MGARYCQCTSVNDEEASEFQVFSEDHQFFSKLPIDAHNSLAPNRHPGICGARV